MLVDGDRGRGPTDFGGDSTPADARWKRHAMTTFVPTLENQVFDAYQMAKTARAEDDYAAMIRWLSRVDELLDRLGGRETCPLSLVPE